ncbi:MAG: hypothetical protein ACTSRA_10605 [Promethearchaeota archaeon]
MVFSKKPRDTTDMETVICVVLHLIGENDLVKVVHITALSWEYDHIIFKA